MPSTAILWLLRICLCVWLAWPAPGAAAERLPGPYEATVKRVVDGDTIGVEVAVWLGVEVDVLVRIRGIDAPEMRGGCESEKARARQAAAALRRMLPKSIVVLSHIEGGKYYGRVVADAATPEGEDVAEALVAAGHARRYDGGARRSWCEGDREEPTG
jgi:micrococcal nuclease